MLKLKCAVQNYTWGTYPPDSEVAELFHANNDVDVHPGTPYAEFWMGTHPNGPSTLKESGESLQAWLQRHPEALGHVVLERLGDQLPFLFKALSVRTALSIQSHPDKELAKALHEASPDIYKDPNHKPEMVIGLTNFEALCGFMPYDEIVDVFNRFPELRNCVQPKSFSELEATVVASTSDQKAALKRVFTEVMLCREDIYSSQVEAIVKRLSGKAAEERSPKDELLLRLNEQYPGDIGILTACFLYYLKRSPGDAVYLPANEPHAYISGDLIECMATSDNVIRAGLTPKLRDARVLCESLSYKTGSPTVLKGESMDVNTVLYRPPFEEFEIRRIVLTEATEAHDLSVGDSPSIILVQRGAGEIETESSRAETCRTGDVFFLSAQTSAMVQKHIQSSEDLVVWMATVNRSIFS